MTITHEQLAAIMSGAPSARIDLFLSPLNNAMDEFKINTEKRQAAFIAQLAHESGQFRYVRELASGAAYEGRKDLGNTQPGDGVKFKGRGLLQITGRFGYTACMMGLGIDCVEHPELLEEPENAARSASWWWHTHGLNEMADSGNFARITRRINGGVNGMADRLAFYVKAQEVLA